MLTVKQLLAVEARKRTYGDRPYGQGCPPMFPSNLNIAVSLLRGVRSKFLSTLHSRIRDQETERKNCGRKEVQK